MQSWAKELLNWVALEGFVVTTELNPLATETAELDETVELKACM